MDDEDPCEIEHVFIEIEGVDATEWVCKNCGGRAGCAFCGKGMELGCCEGCMSPEAKRLWDIGLAELAKQKKKDRRKEDR